MFTEAEGEGQGGPTPVASLGDGPSFRLPVPTGQGPEIEISAAEGKHK